MAVTEETAWMSGAELARRIRQRDLSPVELMTSTTERIKRRNPSLNAFIHLDFDQAMERARAAEAALKPGADLGALHGGPVGMKDLFDFKPGWPATFGGIRPLRNQGIDAYCTYAERMEAAGPILPGQNHSPHLRPRGTTPNYPFRPTPNPVHVTPNPRGASRGK